MEKYLEIAEIIQRKVAEMKDKKEQHTEFNRCVVPDNAGLR